jgi:succinoglycan biosynthesis transport protein ExoP
MLTNDLQTFNIKYYLSILQRRKYVALSTGLIVLSLFTWGSFLMPKTYKATSTVSIENSSVLKPLMQGVGISEDMQDRLRNLKNEITSRNITEKVVKKLGLDATTKNPEQYEALIAGIRKNLDVIVTGGPNFFSIAYTGDDPKKVADVVNTITNTYIEEHMQSRRTDVSDAYAFVRSQVLEYKNKLDESDKAIREFREKNPNLTTRSETTLAAKLETLESSKKEAEIRLKELASMKAILEEQISHEKEFTVAFVTRESSSMEGRLNVLNHQLVLLMMKYTDNYPEVIKVKSEIEEIKKHIAQENDSRSNSASSETTAINPIYQHLKEEISGTDSEIGSLRARISELSRQQREIRGILGSMPKEQEEWTKLQRDRNVHQQVYEKLLQKLENAKVSQNLEFTEQGETFRFVDPAKVPLVPVRPNRVKMILLGIFLGLAAGIGMVFGFEYFDHSFKDEESIEASLKMPVLGAIPRIVSEADEISGQRLDLKVFVASGAYFSIICLVLIKELLSRYMGIKIFNF